MGNTILKESKVAISNLGGILLIFLGLFLLIRSWLEFSDIINSTILIEYFISIILGFFNLIEAKNQPLFYFNLGTNCIIFGIIIILICALRISLLKIQDTKIKESFAIFLSFGIIFVSLAIFLSFLGNQEIIKKVDTILTSKLIWNLLRHTKPTFGLTFLEVGFFMLLGAMDVPFLLVGLTMLFNGLLILIIPTIYLFIHAHSVGKSKTKSYAEEKLNGEEH